MMRPVERGAYWIIAGGLIGFGFLTAFSVGCVFFALGMAMALYWVKQIGPRGFWMTLVSMGVIPDVILLFNYLTADEATTWYGPNYLLYPVVVPFGLIAFAGLAWGLLEAYRHRRAAA